MASYQDIDVRLVGVENALMFLMKSFKVTEVVPNILDPDRPMVRETDMYTFYREQLAKGLLETLKQQPESTNGTDSVESVSSTD